MEAPHFGGKPPAFPHWWSMVISTRVWPFLPSALLLEGHLCTAAAAGPGMQSVVLRPPSPLSQYPITLWYKDLLVKNNPKQPHTCQTTLSRTVGWYLYNWETVKTIQNALFQNCVISWLSKRLFGKLYGVRKYVWPVSLMKCLQHEA